MAFQNTFAGNPLDRASERRTDSAWLNAQAKDPASLAVAIWNGQPLVEDAPQAEHDLRIAYIPAAMARELAGGEERLLFLGLWRETAVFAVDFEAAADPSQGPLNGFGRFEELRASALRLPAGEAAIAAAAKSVFEWRRRHGFCAVCGQPTVAVEGGWKRVCESCRAEHFPRTDPVVIMLPTFGDRCLLGRKAVWPQGMFSALAGYLEPGESIEEACAREIKEEASLTATQIRYHSSQPWPFPSTLMIGLIAEVADDDAEPDKAELEEVRWFTRDDARALVRGEHPDARAPGAMAIAYQLIRAWADA